MRHLLSRITRIVTAPFRLIVRLFKGVYRWVSNVIESVRLFFTEEVEDTPLPETLSKTIENPQEIFVHLDALRKHLLRSVLVLAFTVSISFIFSHQIIDLLAQPLEGGIDSLIAIDVTEPISTVMRVSLLSGFAIALPYITLEAWLFVAPGLKRQSRYYGLIAIPVAVLFYLGGMAFAYFVMMPAALPFLLNFRGISTIPRPSSYIKFVTSLMFWIGLAFEFPLVIFILAKIEVIQAKTLIQQWRLAIVIIAVMAAIITPTIDPVNMALVMGPLILLYFLSVGLAFLAQRNSSSQTELDQKEEVTI